MLKCLIDFLARFFNNNPFANYYGWPQSLHYRQDIDDAIVEELAKSRSGVQSGQLKRSIESAIAEGTISPDVYAHHITTLKGQGVISARDCGRGKPIIYSLSIKARKKRELQVLGSTKISSLRRRILILMFSYLGNAVEPERFEIDKQQSPQYFAKAITEMESKVKDDKHAILKKFETANKQGVEKDLIIRKTSTPKTASHNVDADYDDHGTTISTLDLKLISLLANPETLVKSDSSGLFDIRVKIEERRRPLGVATLVQEIYFYPKDSKLRTHYYYMIDGFSSKRLETSVHSMDFNAEGQSFVEISRTDIQNAVHDLKTNGYINIAGTLGDEVIYRFADEALLGLLDNLKWTSDRRAEYLLYKRKYSNEWTKGDQNWLTLYYGEKKASQLIRQAELSGFQYRKRIKNTNRHSSPASSDHNRPQQLDNEEKYRQELNSRKVELQKAVDVLSHKENRKTIEKYLFLEDILIPICPELSEFDWKS